MEKTSQTGQQAEQQGCTQLVANGHQRFRQGQVQRERTQPCLQQHQKSGGKGQVS